MAEVSQLYNKLPTLGDADDTFVDRNNVFKILAMLLAEYGNIFGLCLVHSHCKLIEGEIMLEKGNISQPEKLENAGVYYPNRWLSGGVPYEFTTKQSPTPPQALLDRFCHVVKPLELDQVLGLYAVEGSITDPADIEWTDGRQNYTRAMKEGEKMVDFVQTAWDFARGDPVTMACTKWCDTRTTRGGAANTHKGTQSHSKS